MAGTVEADPVEEAHYRRFKHEDCDDDSDDGYSDGDEDDDEYGGTMLKKLTTGGPNTSMRMIIVKDMMKIMIYIYDARYQYYTRLQNQTGVNLDVLVSISSLSSSSSSSSCIIMWI